MHLIYLWIEKYNSIQKLGIRLSSKYKVYLKSHKNSSQKADYDVVIKPYTDFIDGFFSPNVFDIAAAVGQNGSGKTTIAHALMECSPEAPCLDFLSSNANTNAYFYIYEEIDKCTNSPMLYIYTKSVSLQPKTTGIKTEIIKIFNTSLSFLQPIVYISNIFNPSEFPDKFTMGDLQVGTDKRQQIFTPSVIMKRNQEKRRKGYHHYYGTSYNAALYELAEIQMQDSIRVYTDYQAAAFLNCYLHAPDNMIKQLPIFDQITITFRPFLNEMTLDQDEKEQVSQWFEKFEQQKESSDFSPNQAQRIPPRYLLEYCRQKIYYQLVNTGKVGWKTHVMSCLFTEVSLLFFGPVMNIYAENINLLLNQEDSILDISFWRELKSLIDNLRYNDNKKSLDSNAIEYYITTFKKYYTEAELILDDKLKDFQEGTFSWEDQKDFLELFECSYERGFMWVKYISLDFHPCSSGEIAMVNLISYMYRAFASSGKTNGDILVIIDEIDAYLHPKWQQQILKWLLEWWEKDETFKNYKIQLFITSHSPIFLSDIPGEKVNRLDKNERGEIRCNLDQRFSQTFGSDIYTLFCDSFFMDQGSIGEFAKSKVNRLLNWIHRKQPDVTDQEAIYLANHIGDHNAARQLKKMVSIRQEEDNQIHQNSPYRQKAEELQKRLEKLPSKKQDAVERYIRQMEERHD